MTLEEIKVAIDALPKDELSHLHDWFQEQSGRFDRQADNMDLMARLREIRIDAPANFAENFKLYVRGEKQIEDVC